jgi:hypothetical protein
MAEGLWEIHKSPIREVRPGQDHFPGSSRILFPGKDSFLKDLLWSGILFPFMSQEESISMQKYFLRL